MLSNSKITMFTKTLKYLLFQEWFTHRGRPITNSCIVSDLNWWFNKTSLKSLYLHLRPQVHLLFSWGRQRSLSWPHSRESLSQFISPSQTFPTREFLEVWAVLALQWLARSLASTIPLPTLSCDHQSKPQPLLSAPTENYWCGPFQSCTQNQQTEKLLTGNFTKVNMRNRYPRTDLWMQRNTRNTGLF